MIIVNETDSIDLVCESLNSLPITNHTWINENSNHYERFVIKDESKDVFKSVLRIQNIDESDNGSFECFLANEVGDDRKTFELLVQTPPKIDSIIMTNNLGENEVNGEINVLENEEVTFDCVVDGYPAPEVSWFKGQDEERISGNESSITISSVHEDDAGNYRCLARNILGMSVKSFRLNVNVPPKVETSQENLIKINENQKLTLNCDFRGNPSPKISWFANEKPAAENENFEISEDNKSFEFEAHLTDSGIYRCLGVNEFGSRSYNFTVLVMGKLECLLTQLLLLICEISPRFTKNSPSK